MLEVCREYTHTSA